MKKFDFNFRSNWKYHLLALLLSIFLVFSKKVYPPEDVSEEQEQVKSER